MAAKKRKVDLHAAQVAAAKNEAATGPPPGALANGT